MKNKWLKYFTIFFLLIGLIVWTMNYIFFNKNAPKSKATGETMALSFNPTTITAGANQDFTVSLFIKPSISTVLRGYKLRVNFDKNKVYFKSIVYKLGVVSQGLGNVTSDAIALHNAQSGYINVIGEIPTLIGHTLGSANTTELVSLTFTSLSTNQNSISTSNGNFYSINSDSSLYDGWTNTQASLTVNGVASATSTPYPPTTAVTISSPTLTPVPTAVTTASPVPTTNSACTCSSAGVCGSSCVFDRFTGVNYSNPIKCSQDADILASTATSSQKNSWCTSRLRTKGDVDGNGILDRFDYFYYVSAVNGGRVPASANVDVDGDGTVSTFDRSIIMRSQPTN